MPENYKLARSEELRIKIEQWQRDREAVADSLIAVRDFNARLSSGRAVWSWPKIKAALTSKHHLLSILCESCGLITEIDLRVKPRDLEASIRIALRDAKCPRCNGHGRPRIVGLSSLPWRNG
jgi:hypothetical protein